MTTDNRGRLTKALFRVRPACGGSVGKSTGLNARRSTCHLQGSQKRRVHNMRETLDVCEPTGKTNGPTSGGHFSLHSAVSNSAPFKRWLLSDTVYACVQTNPGQSQEIQLTNSNVPCTLPNQCTCVLQDCACSLIHCYCLKSTVI